MNDEIMKALKTLIAAGVCSIGPIDPEECPFYDPDEHPCGANCHETQPKEVYDAIRVIKEAFEI